MTAAELKATIERHGLWLRGDPSGSSANLSGANLSRANLSRANLSGANLSGADLSGANLSVANLSSANLSGANLSRADLSRADLSGAYLSVAYLSVANLSGANLSGAYLSVANLSGADLSGANLSVANLSGANLSGADLSRANLSRANLSRANLSGAYLSGAYLSGANLSGAKNFESTLVCDLYLLLDQPGPIRAYKLVDEKNEGPFNGGLTYEVGGMYEVKNANTDPNEGCGAGIHVATLPWVMREWRKGFKVLLVEFWADDIACIPFGTDGKFRLHRCRVVSEKDVTKQIVALNGGAA